MSSQGLIAEFRAVLWRWVESRLALGTQRRYARARAEFQDWCQELGVDPTLLANCDLDVLVARFALHMKEDEDTALARQGCVDLMATLSRRRGGGLHLTAQVLRLWHREEPPQQAEAMPACIAFAMIAVQALVLESPEAAVHTLCAFSGCLRIGESLNLRCCDVVLTRRGAPFQAVLILRATKRSFDQRVVLGHPAVVQMLIDYVARFAPSDALLPLSPMSYARYARIFQKAVSVLRLPGANWRSHSLRRGCATSLMESGWRYEDVKLFGRWSSDSSAREYIRLGQTAVSRLQGAITEEKRRHLHLLAGASVWAFKGLAA